jgi:hypothetical protein
MSASNSAVTLAKRSTWSHVHRPAASQTYENWGSWWQSLMLARARGSDATASRTRVALPWSQSLRCARAAASSSRFRCIILYSETRRSTGSRTTQNVLLAT